MDERAKRSATRGGNGVTRLGELSWRCWQSSEQLVSHWPAVLGGAGSRDRGGTARYFNAKLDSLQCCTPSKRWVAVPVSRTRHFRASRHCICVYVQHRVL